MSNQIRGARGTITGAAELPPTVEHRPETAPAGDDDADLSWTPAQTTTWIRTALDLILEHEAGLGSADVIGDLTAHDLRELLPDRPAVRGEDPSALLRRVVRDLVPRSYNTASPGHFGWIPGGGVLPAAVADLVAGAVNRYTGMFGSAPALVQLEADVLRWFGDWVGYPAEARGVFTTGGSLATFSGVVTAREALLAGDLRRAVVYTSPDAHLSAGKAVRLAGLPRDAVRCVPVDARRRLRADRLAELVTRDRAAGLRPFLVIATAGTTSTGAVDPLHEIADVAARERLWLHVDAAYGGFFRLCPELRPLLDGLSRADSLTVDPHKSLFLPYGTGALLVRDGELLRRAHADTDSYLPAPPQPHDHYDPSQYGPVLSRDFPGLRAWLTIQSYGIERLTAALREKHRLARWAADRLRDVPELRLLDGPDLSLFAFHVRLPGGGLDRENQATRQLVRDVCAAGRTLLTGCRLDGREYARICVLSFRSRAEHVARLVEDVTRAARALAAAPPSTYPVTNPVTRTLQEAVAGR